MSDPLLEPLTVKSLVLRNRIYSPAHAPAGFLENGWPGERYIRYHEEKARGGLALTIIGGSTNVDIDSADVFDNFSGATDAIVPFYEEIGSRVHQFGAAIMVQLTHLGRRSKADVYPDLPAVSPSQVRERAHRSYPRELDRHDIDRIIGAYGRAAKRAQRGGLDGVEIAAMAGHLIDQFWSPRTNLRSDEFGGTLPNRMRFGFLVLEQIRENVRGDFVVGLRLTADEDVAGGLDGEDCLEIASRLAGSGLVDYLSVVYGTASSDRDLAKLIPSFGHPLGAHLELVGRIRAAVSVPVFHAERISDVATARYAVREGLVDMAGMVRGHIADPHLVHKLSTGQEARIRPCVGAAECLGRETRCIHNPATGREQIIAQLITPARDSRRVVVVVGGGVAGLEAARVCAERGHTVTLLEAAADLGGQVRLAARLPRHAEKLSIVGWLTDEIRRLGVTVKRNAFAEAADVVAYAPDIIIIATGGLPQTSLPAVPNDLAVSCADVLSKRAIPGRHTLIYDDSGGQVALTTAEFLASGGEIVELVTPDRMVGHDVVELLVPDYLTLMYQLRVTLVPDTDLTAAHRSSGRISVTLHNIYSGEGTSREVDQLAVDLGVTPLTNLFDTLRAKSTNDGVLDLEAFTTGRGQPIDPDITGYRLFRVGDAVAYRGIHEAIYDARRLCMNL